MRSNRNRKANLVGKNGRVHSIPTKEVANLTARNLGAPMFLVWPIIQVFLLIVNRLLDNGKPVYLRGLGTFRWKKSRRSKGVMLRYIPSYDLRRGREAMEKYGVEFDDEKTKEASQDGKKPTTCPICGKKLDDGGACPVHGTEPFEKR